MINKQMMVKNKIFKEIQKLSTEFKHVIDTIWLPAPQAVQDTNS